MISSTSSQPKKEYTYVDSEKPKPFLENSASIAYHTAAPSYQKRHNFRQGAGGYWEVFSGRYEESAGRSFARLLFFIGSPKLQ